MFIRFWPPWNKRWTILPTQSQTLMDCFWELSRPWLCERRSGDLGGWPSVRTDRIPSVPTNHHRPRKTTTRVWHWPTYCSVQSHGSQIERRTCTQYMYQQDIGFVLRSCALSIRNLNLCSVYHVKWSEKKNYFAMFQFTLIYFHRQKEV